MSEWPSCRRNYKNAYGLADKNGDVWPVLYQNRLEENTRDSLLRDSGETAARQRRDDGEISRRDISRSSIFHRLTTETYKLRVREQSSAQFGPVWRDVQIVK